MTVFLLLCLGAGLFALGWQSCSMRNERLHEEVQRLRDEAWDREHLS